VLEELGGHVSLEIAINLALRQPKLVEQHEVSL
jgi:hypothetical protein